MSEGGVYFLVKNASIPAMARSGRAVHDQIKAALRHGYRICKDEDIAREFDCGITMQRVADGEANATQSAELGEHGAAEQSDASTIE